MPRVTVLAVLTALLFLPRLTAAPKTPPVEKEAIDQAVERGVVALRKMQGADGTWPFVHIGPTALAGLTLLECGVAADDKAVVQAAEAVRRDSPATSQTYALALAILFLDRLGEANDVALIESLTVRLLAGQANNGGWTYGCPPISDNEVRRLTTHLKQRKEPEGRRPPPEQGGKKRTFQDLPREIQQQLQLINRVGDAGNGILTDNSNTQFATLALWVARRHGLPVDGALARIDARYRGSQNRNGGWAYNIFLGQFVGEQNSSTATMTCAALLGLAVAHGTAADLAREKNPRGKLAGDLGKDPAVVNGLLALSTAVGQPTGLLKDPQGQGRLRVQAGGKAYYFLWSLERVAVALDLDTIGGKDWYNWGAELLLANQRPDGTWQDEYGTYGADTCFALLFLRRANLARDLTAILKGRLKDPGEIVLRAGPGSKEEMRVPSKPLPISGPNSSSEKPAKDPVRQPPVREAESARLARSLVEAKGGERERVLGELRTGKGVQYTEALAMAIPQLDAEGKRQARAALADRLTRMKAETLGTYLGDDEAEIRRAAALAAAMKDCKMLIPKLIPLLADKEPSVVRAAHVALKELTGQMLGEDRDAWQKWWEKQSK
jgi:hypothetical protein